MAESVETENSQILAEVQSQFKKGRSVATGIGCFAVLFRGEAVLLRRRSERDSLYQQDLSGKWEMTGGGAENPHFKIQLQQDLTGGIADISKYQRPYFKTLEQELQEEAGLKLKKLPQPFLIIPAWFRNPYEEKISKEKRISIDLAFSCPIPFNEEYVEETPEYKHKCETGEIMLVPVAKFPKIQIVSLRTKFLIEQAWQCRFCVMLTSRS